VKQDSSVLGEWFGEAYGEEGGRTHGGPQERRDGGKERRSGGAAAAEDANGLRVARQVLGREGGEGGASPGLVAGGEEGAPRADHGLIMVAQWRMAVEAVEVPGR